MAGRRRKKRISVFEKQKYRLVGIVLLLMNLFGIGYFKPVGIVGILTKIGASYIVGKWSIVLMLLLLGISIYMVYTNEMPSLFTTKLTGFYIFLLGLIIYSHLNYLKMANNNNQLVLNNTLQDLVNFAKSSFDEKNYALTGGGLVGALFAILFKTLFTMDGTVIVAIVLMIIGVSIFTGFSISELIKKIIENSKNKLIEIKKKSTVKEEKKEESGIANHLLDKLKPKEEQIKETKEEIRPVESLSELENIALKMNNINSLEIAGSEDSEEISNLNNDVKPHKEYHLPSLNLLKDVKNKEIDKSKTIAKEIQILESSLAQFQIFGKVVDIHSGPSVTQYEMKLKPGTKLSKVVSINKELSLALAKKDVRIEAPIPGKDTIGIEVANDEIEPVGLKEILNQVDSLPDKKKNNKLLVALGKNIMGESKFYGINEAPHLLVAGATGSGKSVCINCFIVSLLMRNTPDELKLVLIDPKKVELSIYQGIPHLLTPVVTDPRKANIALKRLVQEMENRFNIFEEAKTKNIGAYNERQLKKKEPLMPYIVCIIDELADLMMVASKEVQDSIMRITQMARAAGIHLIVATQRPSTDIITGVVKSNIPSRISFAVSSSIDSRTILDRSGAEKLLGKGDMLFKPLDNNNPERIQGAFVSDAEINDLVNYTVKERIAEYDDNFLNLESDNNVIEASTAPSGNNDADDALYDEVLNFAIENKKISASLIQRRFRIGYNRAARLVDLLEERGIVGPANGSKPREVLPNVDE